jgi:hypothetical protein
MTMTMRRKLELILCGVGVTVDDARGTADEILDALEEASEEMLAPIACLIAPDDLPDGVVEHPRRLDGTVEKVVETWKSVIRAIKEGK